MEGLSKLDTTLRPSSATSGCVSKGNTVLCGRVTCSDTYDSREGGISVITHPLMRNDSVRHSLSGILCSHEKGGTPLLATV